MKEISVAAVILALLTLPASAQTGGKRPRGDDQKTDAKGPPKTDDKAYKAALERIPEPKEKYDPWRQVRPEPARK